MSDFCRQCAQAYFGVGQDVTGDFVGMSTPEDTAAGLYCMVLCEGCGPVQADHTGQCVSDDCLVDHATGRLRPDLYALVVHCKRARYDIYIGRGKCPRTGRINGWGNPFQIGEHGDRDQVIARYRAWVLAQPGLVAQIKTELRGKVLACWCAPQRCHGHVLAEIANA